MNMDHQNECGLCSEMLLDYISGNINEENRLIIKEHLDRCEDCQKIFDNIENDTIIGNQNKMNFRKLRVKLIAKLIGIVLVILIFLTLIIGFFIPLSLKLIFGYKIPVAERVFINSLQYTLPSAQIISISTGQGIMSLNISCKYYQDFLSASSNQINLTIPNFIGKTTTSKGINSNSIFIESRPITGDNIALWEKMDKISDISVCQVVIYFTKPISTDELDKFLSQINANNRFSWAIIDTGDTDLNYNWGFPIEAQQMFRGNGFLSIPSANYASKDFQTELQYLEENHNYLGSKETENDVAFLNQYIHDNGISIRGVVVVAPTNNLIKLKESDLIAKMNVVKAELDYKMEY